MTLIFWVEPFFEVGLLYHVEYDFASKLFSLYWVIDRISNSNNANNAYNAYKYILLRANILHRSGSNLSSKSVNSIGKLRIQ